MTNLLSNVMPELTEHELKSRGCLTVSYFDKKVNCMVSAKYCSVYFFLFMAGLVSSTKNIDNVYFEISAHGSYSLPQCNHKNSDVTIYDL